MVLTEELKGFINTLVKAKKNIRLYPENNPMYQKTLNDVYRHLSDLLHYVDEISLQFKQFEILYDGEVIYRNEDKEESLALFFFKDGVRELTFLRGIPIEEVEDFLRIISTDFERQMVDDDVVTLMWERDFQFIKYVVDDTILVEDETYEEEAVKQVKEAVSDADIMKAYEEAFGLEKTEEVTIVPLTNDDIQSIVQQIEEEEEDRDKSQKLVYLLFEMLTYARGRSEYEEIINLIKEAIRYAVNRGNLETVIYTIKKIETAIKDRTYNEEVNTLLKGVQYFINSNVIISLLGDVLEAGAEFEEEVLEELAELLSKEAIPHMIKVLGELQNISSRKAIIRMLILLGRKDISLLAKGLSDRRWYVVRNIIYIMRQIRDPKGTEYIIPLLRHPDRRVKKEAIIALGELGVSNAVNLLKDALRDGDESVRITAVRAISQLASPLSKKVIMESIKSKDFRERDFQEKKEFFKALARWPDEETIDYFVGLLKKRSFFRRSRLEEMKAAAAYALGIIGCSDALEILNKLRNSKNPLLKENIEFAIARIRDAGGRA